MGRRKVRRSYDSLRRRLFVIWIAVIFFLCLFTLLDVIITFSKRDRYNAALDAEVNYAQIAFEGLRIGQEVPSEVVEHPIVDLDYDYSWHNISVSVDSDGYIDRLAFFTTTGDDAATIDDVMIDYRGYPLGSISDFLKYFGITKVTNFDHYKYLVYDDNNYVIEVTLRDRKLYNIELHKK